MNNDVSLAGAFLAGLVSFLSPCVLPLVPGYISMLSGIGMEQLRQGEVPRSGLFSSALAFVAGFSLVFVSFGATASAVGGFLKQNRTTLVPIAGALILLFGLHLLGLLIKLSLKAGIVIGGLLVVLGIVSLVRHAPLFAGLGALHFFSLSIIGFLGPSLTRWLNRDVRLRSAAGQPGAWSGFLLGFAFAFGWTPCIGPILTTVLTIAAASESVVRGVVLLGFYSAGLGVPFLLTALGIGQFMIFYKNFRKYLHAVELFSGALLLFIGGLVFLNRLTWLTGKLGFLDTAVRTLERTLTTGRGPAVFWWTLGAVLIAGLLWTVARNWRSAATTPRSNAGLAILAVVGVILITFGIEKAARVRAHVAVSTDMKDSGPEPEVQFKDLDGKEISLASYKGKVVLVNFWATWCEPCRIEIPWLIEMQQKYGAKGFTVLGVAMDEEGKSAVAPFLAKETFDVNGKKFSMGYPIVLGSDAAADKFGGLLGYPTSFLISKDGRILKKEQGLIDYDALTKEIESQF
jgi:cytochrome c-type biogenesis protein